MISEKEISYHFYASRPLTELEFVKVSKEENLNRSTDFKMKQTTNRRSEEKFTECFGDIEENKRYPEATEKKKCTSTSREKQDQSPRSLDMSHIN